MNGTHKTAQGVVRVILMACLGLFALAYACTARAADGGQGLTVEKLTFRDILRCYTEDPAGFGADAGETDAQGVTAAARRLAVFFAQTVGLKYYNVGPNYDYFPVDVTDAFGAEPYTKDNLLSTANVELLPKGGGAVALPAGETTELRVYLTGYAAADDGSAAPIYHYLWQEGERWFAVRDDLPFYRVSYNGMNSAQAAQNGLPILRARAFVPGTESLSAWAALSEAEGDTVDCGGYSLTLGAGGANLFAVGEGSSALGTVGVSTALREVGDYVPGGVTIPAGPLVASCAIASNGGSLARSDTLAQDTEYRFRVTFTEPLKLRGQAQAATLLAQSDRDGRAQISELVWYGAAEYLATDSYNPRSVEFSFRADGGARSRYTFTLSGVAGDATGQAPATFCVSVNGSAAAQSRSTVLETLADCAQLGESAPLTRSALARLLWTLCGAPANSGGDAATQAALWAGETGLMKGYEDGSFGAERVATREEASVVLCRYARLQGMDVTPPESLPGWSDADAVSPWAADAVGWCAGAGILPGPEAGPLDPKCQMTCGLLADMLAVVLLRSAPVAG